jgi:tRNA (Thr-GGU) A37 N-methylase
MPGSGVVAAIQVDPRFEGALEGVERSSHLIVVRCFHEASATVNEALARRHARTTRCGAFAARCPDRPSPLP